MSESDFRRPEIFVGLVGPIGCDIQLAQISLSKAFKRVDYAVHEITLSDSIEVLLAAKDGERPNLRTLEEKIEGGNKAREVFGKNGVLAAHAIKRIRECRAIEHARRGETFEGDALPEQVPADGTCYIIRQLKLPEEVELLKKVYGKQFVQISITQERKSRISNLAARARRESPGNTDKQNEEQARRLLERDEHEENIKFGQRLSKIFHLGDVFINSQDEETASSMSQRFVDALFGKNDISPTKDEFGSYLAKAASLRSVDLSRQVGAAILTQNGDIITVGCNEVPKPGGGNYWHEDPGKSRDIDRKGEANKEETSRIIYDFLRTLEKHELFSEGHNPDAILADRKMRKEIFGSLIGGITEYGRMIHAEMNAIADAARLGRSVRGATLYVTTFPCHNCAKHIIGSGIEKVVFIEPYPKSRAEFLYSETIAVEEEVEEKIPFVHFEGISPRRYRDIFEKGNRRNENGEVDDWYEGRCTPRVGTMEVFYSSSEEYAISENLEE